MALGEHLEEQLGTGLGERHMAEFVDNQKFVAGELAPQAQQLLFVAGLDRFVDQGSSDGEANREALLGTPLGPNPGVMYVLPVPLLPTTMMFSRRASIPRPRSSPE